MTRKDMAMRKDERVMGFVAGVAGGGIPASWVDSVDYVEGYEDGQKAVMEYSRRILPPPKRDSSGGHELSGPLRVIGRRAPVVCDDCLDNTAMAMRLTVDGGRTWLCLVCAHNRGGEWMKLAERVVGDYEPDILPATCVRCGREVSHYVMSGAGPVCRMCDEAAGPMP
jgi:hypothetical protein